MLLAVSSHPVQYRAPLYRYLRQHGGTPVHALYRSDRHLRTAYDPGFGVSYRWATDLLAGYASSFVAHGTAGDRLALWRAFWSTYKAVTKVVRADRDISAVLLHSYATVEGIAGLLAAKQLGLPALLMEETELTRRRPILKRLLRLVLLTPLLRLYDAFLYIGTRNRQFYERYGVQPDQLFFAPYSVDNDAFSNAVPRNLARREETRRALGAQPSDCVALFAGKLIVRKRPLDLLEAVARLPAHGQPFLAFVGAGELSAALRSRAAELGVRRIAITGFKNIDEIGQYYAAADVFVLPSAFETWGLVLNEAMLHSLPAIVSDGCGCAPDLVRDGETGFRYPPGGIEALAARLEALVRDETLRHDMGIRARGLIENWSYAQVARGVRAALAFVNASGTRAAT